MDTSIKMNSVTGIPYSSYDYVNNMASNPIVLIILTVVVVLYFILFASLGNNENGASGVGTNSSAGDKGSEILKVLLWCIFISLVLLNGTAYFFDVDIVTGIKKIFSPVPEIDVAIQLPITEESTSKLEKEVFHIPGNKYTYDDSKAICNAYDAELANYDQIENSYKKGGEWCSFGWSDGQYAYYPTQKTTWDKLQDIPGHEHDCGHPGINGGFIANPNVRFGVNCYGYKPDATPLESKMMSEEPAYPKSQEEMNFEKRVDYWRQNLSNILISPFNNNQWNIS